MARSYPKPPWLTSLALVLLLAAAVPAAAGPVETLRLALMLGCDGRGTPAAMTQSLPDAVSAEEQPIPSTGPRIGTKWTVAMRGGGRVVIRRYARDGRLLTLLAEYDAPVGGKPRPALAARGGDGCFLANGRRLEYDAEGRAIAVDLLDAEMQPTGARELLLAEPPPGRDPGGVTVAQVDTGVNYLLPEIADHLARDAAGRILGYDYWAMDALPFDRHPIVSPFYPERHGTKTASVLLREAPRVRLIPYRYPRPEMSRMGALVDDAAAKGAAILTLSLGSNDAGEWRSFAAAARRHPAMLIVVSAGNDGRDIDAAPVYPAALDLPNKITVTALDSRTGRLPDDANWGAGSVDLAVPAENIPVIGFGGEEERVSGTSYAAPRVAALAARLLLAHPGWHAAALAAAIFARAKPLLGSDGKPLLRHGVILDPLAR